MAVWSEVKYSETLKRARIDAEYYQPIYLRLQSELEKELKQGNAFRLGDMADVEYGYMPMQDYVSEVDGEPLLRVTNLKGHLEVDDSDLKYIPKGLGIPDKKRLRPGDVLLVQCGDTTGKVGLIAQKHVGMLYPSFCLAIRSKDDVPPEILALFLYSSIGQMQIKQRVTLSTVRPNTTKPDVKDLIIPKRILKPSCVKAIKTMVDLREKSKEIYADAESLLLSELGLNDLDLSHELFYETRFAETLEAGRIDAEHFQPKYERIVDRCMQYKGGYSTLGGLLQSLTNGVECRTFVKKGVPYIRVGDMGKLRIHPDSAQQIEQKDAEKLISKIQLKVGDVLTARSGSIGQAAIVTRADVNSVLSSHLMRLRLNKESPVKSSYFALFLAALPGVQQVLKNGNGGIVPEISQPSLKKLIIPIPPLEFQQELGKMIAESYYAEDESKRLLEEAKRIVEELVLGEEG